MRKVLFVYCVTIECFFYDTFMAESEDEILIPAKNQAMIRMYKQIKNISPNFMCKHFQNKKKRILVKELELSMEKSDSEKKESDSYM